MDGRRAVEVDEAAGDDTGYTLSVCRVARLSDVAPLYPPASASPSERSARDQNADQRVGGPGGVSSRSARRLFDPNDPVGPAFVAAVGAAITTFLDRERAVLHDIDADLRPLIDLAKDFTAGGKRLRPAFCYWGYVAAANQPIDPGPLVSAAASLELLHVSALIHDDLMDSSDTRRGIPSAHRQFEARHREFRGRGSDVAYGRAAAILLGDMLTMWSVEMLQTAGLPPARVAAASPLVAAMRTEVTAGQFLDVMAQAAPASDAFRRAVEHAETVVEYKSARYTVQRPAQFGAALGGASDDLITALGAFGSALGRAFQFRDDVLGIFGDSSVTGKPAGDDLREGKRTVLIAHAMASSTPKVAAELDSMLGRLHLDAATIERGREIIRASGALDAVEQMISDNYARALAALKGVSMTEQGRTALTCLARASVERNA